jgi:hypothetical protein
MPPDLTTTDSVVTAIRLFPGAVIMPNHGCVHCSACQLITRTGTGCVTIHADSCPTRVTI